VQNPVVFDEQRYRLQVRERPVQKKLKKKVPRVSLAREPFRKGTVGQGETRGDRNDFEIDMRNESRASLSRLP